MATPTKARKVQAEAVAEEAPPVLQSVTIKGTEFKFSADPMEWGVETLEKLEEGKLASAIAGILGLAQYKAFQRLGVTTREAVAILDEISSSAGAENSGN